MEMYKICVLLLCINFAYCAVTQFKIAKCDDCMPIRECNEALQYMNITLENLSQIGKFYCGMSDSLKVCCSKMKYEHPNLKLLPVSCGNIHDSIITNRITFGSFAAIYEFPWMVLISYKDAGGNKFSCAGTIINSRYVLTAAHCVHNKEIEGVRVGDYNIGEDTDCDEYVCESHLQDIRVEKRIIHGNYNNFKNYMNDIALLRLKEDVDFSFKNAGTICLPLTKELQNRVITDKIGTIAGWGKTEYNRESVMLLKVKVPVRSKEECQSYYSYMSDPEINQFCAGQIQMDSCKGDSGGPLMIEDICNGDSKYVQYGIISNGAMNCGSDRPGVYMDVRKYVKWILDNIKE